MESEHGSGSSKYSAALTEVTVSESDLLNPGKKSGSTSSSSSRSSFDENFFLLDKNELSKSNANTTSPPALDEDAQLASREGEQDVPNGYSVKYESYDLESPGSTSPPGPESSLHSVSLTQSPPIQLMVRSDNSSSYRIPSSVFARSKSTTTEWSVGSNESLFSINVGNNSFPRDNFFLMAASGELGKSGELIFPSTKSGELILSNKPPPSSSMVDPEKNNLGLGVSTDAGEAAAVTMKEVLWAAAEDRSKEHMPPAKEFHHSSRNIPHHSEGSGNNISSFASPVRRRCACLSCYGSNGRWAFCHCTWPFCSCSNCIRPCCHCTWPFCSCSNCIRPFCHCTWPSCYCCNCSWKCCYCSNCCSCSTFCFSPSIFRLRRGGRRSASVKLEPERQKQKQSQPHAHGASQKVGGSKWFRCCCNFPSCC